jgi:phospholipase C
MTFARPPGGSCQNQEYLDNVVFPDVEHAKILKDIESCSLQQVSWVIPDGKWSDHPGEVGHDGGPSWVAHIVNAIGNSWEQSKVNGQNHHCDYWGTHTPPSSTGYQPTVILIVWDDWGGWYDHVSPDFPSGPGIGYAHDSSNSGWYVNGFRVPMLVVSAFNKHVTNGTGGFDGYISGPPDNPPNYHTCLNTNYCHDFGSILNFVEFTFGSGGSYLGTMWDQHSDYADHYAPDAKPTCTSCDYSLSDFFDFTQSPTAFTAITGMKYAETCFHNPDQTGCWPAAPDADPDDDADEN